VIDTGWNVSVWPISEAAAILIKVRSLRHTGPDLLRLNSLIADSGTCIAARSKDGPFDPP
jgi:hypothetical protein